MTYRDDINKALDAHDAEDTEYKAHVESALEAQNQQIKTLTGDRDTWKAKYEEHMATVHPTPEPPPDPPPAVRTLIGAAYYDNINKSDGVEKDAGTPYDGVRIYASDSSVTKRDQMVSLIGKAAAIGNNQVCVSVKPPYPWADMANGRADPWIRANFKAWSDAGLKYGTTIWGIVSHEPENDTGTNVGMSDAGMAAWKAMQSHIGQLVKGKYPSLLFGPCLMGYHSQPKVAASKWWGLEKCIPTADVDFVMFDLYEDTTNVPVVYKMLADFCNPKGLRHGLGEYGIKKADYAADPTQMDKTMKAVRDNKGSIVLYYNTMAKNTQNPDPNTSYFMEPGGPRYNNWVRIVKNKTLA